MKQSLTWWKPNKTQTDWRNDGSFRQFLLPFSLCSPSGPFNYIYGAWKKYSAYISCGLMKEIVSNFIMKLQEIL